MGFSPLVARSDGSRGHQFPNGGNKNDQPLTGPSWEHLEHLCLQETAGDRLFEKGVDQLDGLWQSSAAAAA